MAEERMAAVDVVCKAREAVRRFVHELMEEEVTAVVGAGRYERSEGASLSATGYATASGTRG